MIPGLVATPPILEQFPPRKLIASRILYELYEEVNPFVNKLFINYD
jgi:hypothetical protein